MMIFFGALAITIVFGIITWPCTDPPFSEKKKK